MAEAILLIFLAIGANAAVNKVTAPPETVMVCQIQSDGKSFICEKRIKSVLPE